MAWGRSYVVRMQKESCMPGVRPSEPRAPKTPPDQPANVSSDRVPATDAEPEGSLDKVKTGPLGIQEIEKMEDDAKGG